MEAPGGGSGGGGGEGGETGGGRGDKGGGGGGGKEEEDEDAEEEAKKAERQMEDEQSMEIEIRSKRRVKGWPRDLSSRMVWERMGTQIGEPLCVVPDGSPGIVGRCYGARPRKTSGGGKILNVVAREWRATHVAEVFPKREPVVGGSQGPCFHRDREWRPPPPPYANH